MVDVGGCVGRPVFLPNPSDGSLYTFDINEGVKKLPFTIPDLVNTAPCKSSDGRLLYTGCHCSSFCSLCKTSLATCIPYVNL